MGIQFDNNDFFKKCILLAFFYTRSSQYGDYLKTWDVNNKRKILVTVFNASKFSCM